MRSERTKRRSNVPTLFQQNDKLLWNTISTADKRGSGGPIRALAEKWALVRHPLGVLDAVDLLHAASRFNVQLPKVSIAHIRKVIEPRKSGLYSDQYVGRLLVSLRILGFNTPVRKLVGAFAPKVALCNEPLSERTFAALASLCHLRSCPETDNFLEALLPKLEETKLELEPKIFSRIIRGLCSMDPFASEVAVRFLSVAAEKLERINAKFSREDIAYTYEALHHFSRTSAGLTILEMLYPRLTECEDIQPLHFTRILIGLSEPHPKYVENDSKERADSIVERTIAFLNAKAAEQESEIKDFSAADCTACLKSLPGLGDGPYARGMWNLLAKELLETEKRTLAHNGKDFVLGKTLIAVLKWTESLKGSPELDSLVGTLKTMLKQRKSQGAVTLAKRKAEKCVS